MDIICRDCGVVFPFTDNEQNYYKRMGLNRPYRCPDCRRLSKEFRFENLDTGIRQSPVEVVCPCCAVIYYKELELSYRSSDYSWKVGGYHAIICDDCKSKKVSIAVGIMKKALEPRKIGGWTFV